MTGTKVRFGRGRVNPAGARVDRFAWLLMVGFTVRLTLHLVNTSTKHRA